MEAPPTALPQEVPIDLSSLSQESTHRLVQSLQVQVTCLREHVIDLAEENKRIRSQAEHLKLLVTKAGLEDPSADASTPDENPTTSAEKLPCPFTDEQMGFSLAQFDTAIAVMHALAMRSDVLEHFLPQLKIARKLFPKVPRQPKPTKEVRLAFFNATRAAKRESDVRVVSLCTLRYEYLQKQNHVRLQLPEFLRKSGISLSSLQCPEHFESLLSIAAHPQRSAGGLLDGTPSPSSVLHFSRPCYVCRNSFNLVHHFYDKLCPECAEINFEKRHQTASMAGKIAIVTGGRIKIGLQIVLKLLRAGCRVVATTRFPHCAIQVYMREADFDQWSHRLQLYALDMRDTAAVETFCDWALQHLPHLDVLMNNAAQTIAKPPHFYDHMFTIERDTDAIPAELRPLLVSTRACSSSAGSFVLPWRAAQRDLAVILARHQGEHPHHLQTSGGSSQQPAQLLPPNHSAPVPSTQNPAASVNQGPPSSTAQSTAAPTSVGAPALVSAATSSSQLELCYPLSGEHARWIEEDQIDLRKQNSWTLRMADTTTLELLEVHAVNAIAPFVLAARLRPLLVAAERIQLISGEPSPASPQSELPNPTSSAARDHLPVRSFVVNVSAMEGQFYRFKTSYHVHTNMTKAALNMLTRTAALDYAFDGIWMGSVDTGWITHEVPPLQQHQRQQAAQQAAQHTTHFSPPLDAVDAAARCLDPVFQVLKGKSVPFGQFYKDYNPTYW
jgi:NAD(P)-dependent dehydrogenase (short-subunit alcohol dehydrogenase family)